MSANENQLRIKTVSRQKQRYFYDLVNSSFLNMDVDKTITKYKIAILVSGGLRNFVTTQPWMNKFLIDPLEADVFVHGWVSQMGIEHDSKMVNNYTNIRKFKILDRSLISLEIPSTLQNKYPRHKSQGWGMEVADHILGQLYNIKSCYELIEEYEIEHGFKYDIIIRVRPDEFWFDRLLDSDLIQVAENPCLATPQNYLSVISGNLINDRFAMGNRVVMGEYCKMFDYLSEYVEYAGDDEATEFYTNYHVTQTMKIPIHNIDISFMLDYPYDYPIEPGFDHTTMRHLSQNDSAVANFVANQIKKNNGLL